MNITNDKNITKVYYSPDIVENVVAVSDLQHSGHNVIFPATTNNSGGAWIINNNTNKLIYKTSDNFLIDVHSTNSKLQINTVYSHLDINQIKIKDKVADLQRRFGYPSKHSFLELSQNIDNFPINEKQIKDYYVNFPWCDMGRMTRSTFNKSNKSRNIVSSIGDIVTTDAVNIKSYGSTYDVVHLFFDEYSKYVTVIFGKRNDAANTFANNIKRIIQYYKKYNHVIKAVQTDALQIYHTAEFLAELSEENIIKRMSAPQEQQQNGKIERYIRIFNEEMSSIRQSAPWVPGKLIGLQIVLWTHLWNLRSGSSENISRKEEFENIRPSAIYNDIPGGYGDAFLVHDSKSIRKDNFSPHGRGPVMYIGPNFQSKDAHFFYDPIRYKRISNIPPKWLLMKEVICPVMTEDNIMFDRINGTDYDIWHRGALPNVIENDQKNGENNVNSTENFLVPNNGSSALYDVNNCADVASLGTQLTHREKQRPRSVDLIVSPVYSTPSGRSGEILPVNESPPVGMRHEPLGKTNGDPAQNNSIELKKFKVSMIHVCHNLPEENHHEKSQFGLKFERKPTQDEIRNTILEIKKVWKIHGNKPSLKNKKGTSRHTSPDVPKLSAALLSSDADE